MTNEELLAAFAGSQRSDLFAEIARRFNGLLHRIAWESLHNAADVDDAAQEALIRIWKNAASFHGHCLAVTWIWEIARNAATDICRRKMAGKRRCVVNMTDSLLTLFPSHSSQSDWEHDAADVDAIRQCLANLPEIHRSVVQLVDIEERSYEEAAAVLQLPIGTIRSRRHRAIVLLRDMFSYHNPRGGSRACA